MYEGCFFYFIITLILNLQSMNFEIDAIQSVSNILAIVMTLLVIVLNYDCYKNLRDYRDRKVLPLIIFSPLFSDVKMDRLGEKSYRFFHFINYIKKYACIVIILSMYESPNI